MEHPNIVQKGVNFTKAIMKHALTGFSVVSKTEHEERLKICDTCDKCDKRDAKNWACFVCGCYLNEKAWMKSESCPEGKWASTEPKNPNKDSSCGCG